MKPQVRVVESAEGQVRVECGVGRVFKVVPPPDKGPFPFVEVHLATGDMIVSGWADRRLSPFWELFADGLGGFARHFRDVDAYYRIEMCRLPDVDTATPINDLADDERWRRLVFLGHHFDAAGPAAPPRPAASSPKRVSVDTSGARPVSKPKPADPLAARWASFTAGIRACIIGAAGTRVAV